MTDIRSALVEGGIVKNVAIGKVEGLPECGPDVSVGWTFDGAVYAPAEEVIDLDAAKSRKIAGLTSQCAAAILSGYTSDALGAAHTYPNKTTDQINMMGSVTASLLPDLAPAWTTPFWVCDAEGAWAWKLHNAAQIQHAGRDGKAHVLAAQTKLADLTVIILAAATHEDVEAVTW